MRRIAALLALALALALPGATLAASTTGAMSETLTVGATISAVFPASIDYVGGSGGHQAITGISTNAPAGLTVSFVATPMTSGANTIALAMQYTGGNIGTGGIVAVPDFSAFTAGSMLFGSSTGPVSAATLDAAWFINDAGAVPGVYAGSINFTVATNP